MMVRLIFLWLLYSGSACLAQEFTVIGNETGSQSYSGMELRNVFKPRNSIWPNGRPVVIVLPGTTSSIRNQVAKEVYNSSFVAMQKYWLSLVFQGRFNAPVILNTDEETINFIRKTPGAIGFVQDPAQVPPALIIRIKD